MAIISAIHVPDDLPPIDFVRLFGGQQFRFRIVPPPVGVRFVFTFGDGHQITMGWPNSLRTAEHYVARVVILPLDGEFIDAATWRIYADINGQHIGTVVTPTYFSARTGRFGIGNIPHDEPTQHARLVEFYRGNAGDEIADFFAVSAQGLFDRPPAPA